MGVVHKLVRTARTTSFESKMAAASSKITPSPPAAPSTSTSATAAATPTATSTATPASKYPRFGRRGAPQAFPSKLYEILEGENPDIIGWTATGRGFEVRDHARLSSEVLGRFFKQDKFSSFQRQLNLYGFRKITKGGESGSYQHPHFRRGERTTLLTIRRSTKAASARVVVPVSPPSAGAGTPQPTVLPSNGNGNGSVSSKNTSKNKRLRSATPSPPPATVSRGVLPWPRPAMPLTNAAMLQQQHATAAAAAGACEGSPNGSSGTNTTGEQLKQQQWPTAAAASGTEGGSGNSWVSLPDPANTTSKSHTSEDVNVAAAEKAALDHQDAEVVSLLQRMATEAQDSPERKRAALVAQQWNVRHLEEGATPSSFEQQLQQPRFEMPKLGAPGAVAVDSIESGQAHQTAFTEHLYDILGYERSSAGAAHQAAGFFPSSAFIADERATAAFPRQLQHHQQYQLGLPSPLGTASPTFSSSDGTLLHLSQPPCRNDAFGSSASANRGSGCEGGEEMVMSEQDRQVLVARSRSGPAFTAEQDEQQVLLARSHSGPANFNRNDEHHYHQQQQQQQHYNASLVYEPSPNRSSMGGRRGGFSSFDGTRFGSRPSLPSSVLPPLPSLKFEQFTGGTGGSGSGAMEIEKVRRPPWHGAESSYVN